MFKSQYEINTNCISQTLYVKLELASSHLLMQISKCYFAQKNILNYKNSPCFYTIIEASSQDIKGFNKFLLS
jgi:hypothetical protein